MDLVIHKQWMPGWESCLRTGVQQHICSPWQKGSWFPATKNYILTLVLPTVFFSRVSFSSWPQSLQWNEQNEATKVRFFHTTEIKYNKWPTLITKKKKKTNQDLKENSCRDWKGLLAEQREVKQLGQTLNPKRAEQNPPRDLGCAVKIYI